MSPLEFLRKAVSIRRKLIRDQKSYRPLAEMEAALEPIERWLKFWNGKATDEGALVIIRKYEMNVRDIIPGGNSACAPKLRAQLKQFLSQNHTEMKQLNIIHREVPYRVMFKIDEANQKIEIHGVFVQGSPHNIIGIVDSSSLASIQAELESKHLTHAA